jgi:hypothetical protein
MITSEKYKGFDRVLKLKRICSAEISNVNWHELKDYLLNEPKDDATNDGPSWMVQQSSVAAGICSYEDSRTQLELCVPSLPDNLGTWLCLTFKDLQWNKQTNNPRVASAFKNTIDYMSQLPGVIHVSVHFVSPKFLIVKHTDASGIYSMLSTISISKNNPEQVIVYLGDGTEYNFKDREFFTFIPEIEHSSANLSDSDWVFIMLRINKEYYND